MSSVSDSLKKFMKGSGTGVGLVGEYYADLIVECLVIIELKCAEALCEAHEAQLLNYLKATDIEVGLLLKLGPKPAFAGRSLPTIRSVIES